MAERFSAHSVPKAADLCEDLMAAAGRWRQMASEHSPLSGTADRFAQAIPNAKPIKCLRSLLHHHETYCGGFRWFVLRNSWIEPRAPWRAGASLYRFRLWPLCRLATQCGVLQKMPGALHQDIEANQEETSEANDE